MIFLQRLLKGILAISVGAFGLLVAVDNVLDYNTNWQFVQHVLSMDSMEPWFNGSTIRTRAITSPFWQQAGYITIITGEFITGLLCSLGDWLCCMAHSKVLRKPLSQEKNCLSPVVFQRY
nr:DUF2165 domain-containing protein [Enterobacter sp. ODB01]